METFLLNDAGEVLLEVNSKLNFRADMFLEVDEKNNSAILKSDGKCFNIDFVHPDLIMPLKKKRYLFVVERNEQFSFVCQKLAKVVFVS